MALTIIVHCDRLHDMNHRDLVKRVRKRMNELAFTPYQLHQKLEGKVSKQTVYNFVEHGKVIKSDTLIILLDALGMTIRRGK